MRHSLFRSADFKWSPINNKTEFRLLTISPSKGKEIATHMTVHLRDYAPQYEAISYTWGNQKRDQVIRCNGQRLRVTKNCKRALQVLRDRRRAYQDAKPSEGLDAIGQDYVWIDALCINQDDEVERSGQVAVMAEIYRNAWRTLVYLGSCPYARLTIKTLIDEDALFKRAWFTRTWIVQEVMCSLHLVVLFDDHEEAWSVLEDSKRNETGTWMGRSGVRIPEIIAMRQAMMLQPQDLATRDLSASVRYPFIKLYEHEIRALSPDGRTESKLQYDRRTKGLKYSSLLDMLERTKDFGCADPRDKLFGIIALFEKPTPSELAPNYSKTVAQVYTDLSWYLIQQNIFLAMSFNFGEGRSSKIPSWVVDWEHDSLLYSSIDDTSLFAPETAARGRNAGFWRGQEKIYARREDSCLIIRGLLISTWQLSSSRTSVMSIESLENETCRYRSGPRGIRTDDCVVVLIGFATPFVLRQVTEDTWKLLGECIVDGLMSGEALRSVEEVPEMTEEPMAPLQDFRIC